MWYGSERGYNYGEHAECEKIRVNNTPLREREYEDRREWMCSEKVQNVAIINGRKRRKWTLMV